MVLKLIVAAVVAYVIFRLGLWVIKGFARPLPPPPPDGDMRRLKLVYKCSSCGLEIRTVKAATEDPEPPRHCMDEMDLVATNDL